MDGVSKDTPLFGWTTCLTYESSSRLGIDHFDNLLDQMKAHGMGRLIVMAASHYHFDLQNHGLAWQARNPSLKPMVDARAINANPDTEFLSRILGKAHQLGIDVYLEVKYAGMEGIRGGYPEIEVWTDKNGRPQAESSDLGSPVERERLTLGHVCHDNDAVQRYMKDQLTDLLALYPTADGIIMEWPGYSAGGCYCSGSLAKFKADTGGSLADAPEDLRRDWQNHRVSAVLAELSALIKNGDNQRQFALYTGFSPTDGNIERSQNFRGHRVDTLTRAGLDFVMPYCEGRHRDREETELERVIDYLEPFECYVHCTIRRKPPSNYPVPPKDPAYIRRIIQWALDYYESHPHRFAGMTFFNEVNVPEENRLAVYEGIGR